jgi:hypothetical protein
MLCTTLHLPTESRTALEMLDDFTTPSFDTDGFVKRPDFLELATRFGLRSVRATALLNRFESEQPGVEALLSRAFLSSEAKTRYRSIFADRLRAIAD